MTSQPILDWLKVHYFICTGHNQSELRYIKLKCAFEWLSWFGAFWNLKGLETCKGAEASWNFQGLWNLQGPWTLICRHPSITCLIKTYIKMYTQSMIETSKYNAAFAIKSNFNLYVDLFLNGYPLSCYSTSVFCTLIHLPKYYSLITSLAVW